MSDEMVFVGYAPCGCIHAAWIDSVTELGRNEVGVEVGEMVREGLRVVYQPLGDGVQLNADCGHFGVERDTRDAQIAALQAEVKKLISVQRLVDHHAEIHASQYYQERKNAAMLYHELSRHAPEALKSIREKLFQSTNEYDKCMSDMVRNAIQQDAQIAALQAEVARLQSALTPFAALWEAWLDMLKHWDEAERGAPDFFEDVATDGGVDTPDGRAYEAAHKALHAEGDHHVE